MNYVSKVGETYYLGAPYPQSGLVLVAAWPGRIADGPPQVLAEVRRAYFAEDETDE